MLKSFPNSYCEVWVAFRGCILISSLFFFSVNSSLSAERIWLENATVDGKAVRMCFDSGSSAAILTSEAVERLKLKVLVPPTNGFGDTAVCDASLDGIPFQSDFGILNLPSYAKPDFDAIMGWGPLSSNIMQIDGSALKLKVLREVPALVQKWTQFPIAPDSGTLDLEIPDKGSVNNIITIDTGTDAGLELPPREWKVWREAHPHAPITLRTYMTADGLFVSEESWADKIQIGPLVVTDVPVMEESSSTKIELGSERDVLGIAALDRLDLVVDGVHSVLYLRSKTTPPHLYVYNRLGAVFCPAIKGRTEAVAKVVRSSPAFEAGIRDGDVLLQINGTPALCWTNDWWHDLDDQAGTVLHMVLRRDGTNFDTTAVLREILHPGRSFSAETAESRASGEAEADASEQSNEKIQRAETIYNKGTEETKAGNLDAALKNFSNAIETDPELAEAYYGRGYVENLQTNIDGAISDFSKAIELKPDYTEAYGHLGTVKQAKGDTAGALADYNKEIELRPDSPEAYANRAQIEVTQRNQDAALADYNKAIDLKLKWPQLYFYRGYLELMKGDTNRALADYDKTIALKPEWALVYGNRAQVEASEGDLDRAEADSAEAAKLDTRLTANSATAFHFMGWSRYERLEYSNALSDFRRACELNPSDDYAHFGVWICDSSLGGSEKATKELKDYLASRPASNFGDWPGEIGRFLAGEITEHNLLDAAVDSNSEIDRQKHSEAYFYIGSKRLIAGDKVGAAVAFEKALAAGTKGFAEYDCAKAELKSLQDTN